MNVLLIVKVSNFYCDDKEITRASAIMYAWIQIPVDHSYSASLELGKEILPHRYVNDHKQRRAHTCTRELYLKILPEQVLKWSCLEMIPPWKLLCYSRINTVHAS
jgi:hypothetical protein